MMKKIIHSYKETAPCFAFQGFTAGHGLPPRPPALLCALVPVARKATHRTGMQREGLSLVPPYAGTALDD